MFSIAFRTTSPVSNTTLAISFPTVPPVARGAIASNLGPPGLPTRPSAIHAATQVTAGPGPLASDAGSPALGAPGTHASPPDVAIVAQNAQASGPQASDAGRPALGVPGTHASPPGAAIVAPDTPASGPLRPGVADTRLPVFASFDGGSPLPSVVNTPPFRLAKVYGRLRCVPPEVFHALRSAADLVGVPFPLDSSFLAAGPSPLVVPSTDAAILDALIADSRYGIPGTLALFRGQTLSDPRPNKALRPWLYRAHLASYPDLDLLCLIATHGVIPPWKDPSSRFGVRQVPANYTVVTDKLLADYYKGRCIIATVATLERDPRFHSSAFALVPKKDKPLHLDGCIFHDLSAPDGRYANAQTSSEDAPDASWDPFVPFPAASATSNDGTLGTPSMS
ncbi:unnamed protein product [Phytophthora fragariaefolia]|uniref:Unnamed protein product n=1 Tax=Phytophthora fragariaefolia TaxID=1490495 RepID=A0A9W6XQX7_9STRA|nr:unnamed protein product [Phytophthora fragariaefolia]